MEVAEKSYYDSLDRNCYMHITLTDEEDIPDARYGNYKLFIRIL